MNDKIKALIDSRMTVAASPGNGVAKDVNPKNVRHQTPSASDDLARILALPRREPRIKDDAVAAALVDLMTKRFRFDNPKCKCASMGRKCIQGFNPAQAWALYEAGQTGGILGAIGVGHGKTALDFMIAMVLPNCKKVVLLIPPGLKAQLMREYLLWREHFRVPSIVMGEIGHVVHGAPVIHVVSYSIFSRAQSTSLMIQHDPDTVVADEGHKLRHANTATTGRVLRFFQMKPNTRLCTWSGTLTARSVKDYSHLAALALDAGSPLPLAAPTVAEWASAIDPSDWPAPPGILLQMCKQGESLHEGFHRRLSDTKGVITTTSGSGSQASLNIIERDPGDIPDALYQMIVDLRKSWTRPDGEEFVDILQVQACAKQLACGFYYRWKFPKMEPEALIKEWLLIRKAWHKEVREKLKQRTEHLDSPFLVTKAAIRFQQGYHLKDHPPGTLVLPVWDSFMWPEWKRIHKLVEPETEAVWVDDYLVDDAADWIAKHRGIVWYEFTSFGDRVARRAGVPMHGGGPGAEARILAETGSTSIVASIKSHGTGRDGLQRIFREQLIANPQSSGDAWEQLLGRLSREGQEADDIDTWVYRHTEEMEDAIEKAWQEAEYIQATMGTRMKVLSAAVSW